MTSKWLEQHNVRVYHKCVTSVPESQMSITFALWPASFELQAVLRKVHAMTRKWPWTLKGARYSISWCSWCPLVPYLSSFCSMTCEPFWSYRPFWDKCTAGPQNDLEPYKVKGTPYTSYLYPKESKISVCFTIWPAILELHTILRHNHSALNDPKWPWTLQGQGCPIYVLPVSLGPKFQSISL